MLADVSRPEPTCAGWRRDDAKISLAAFQHIASVHFLTCDATTPVLIHRLGNFGLGNELTQYVLSLHEAVLSGRTLLLDLPLALRPCPGARAGFASELQDMTGRRTVARARPHS